MKSLPALIWSCCISVLTPSSSSLWGVFRLSSAPLLLLRVILPLLFPRDHVWVSSLSSSQPSGFDAYLSLPTLYVMLPHLPLGVSPCSPLLQGARSVSVPGKCCFLSATIGNADLTAWYSNNVMKFNIFCTMIKLEGLCITLQNKWCHDTFKKETGVRVVFFLSFFQSNKRRHLVWWRFQELLNDWEIIIFGGQWQRNDQLLDLYLNIK